MKRWKNSGRSNISSQNANSKGPLLRKESGLFLLRQLLELNNKRIGAEKYDKAFTLYIYIVARVFKILILLQKQHEDLHIEFKEEIKTIGKLIGKNHLLMKTAIHNGLDVNWLIQFEIPKNIGFIYKTLRENGQFK